jgi:hypothetical protein
MEIYPPPEFGADKCFDSRFQLRPLHIRLPLPAV